MREWGPPPGGGYVRRPGSRDADARPEPSADARERLAHTGIDWDPSRIDLDLIGGTGDIERARARFRANLPEIIWDAAKLEGNTFTLPEVRTLLDGVTVAGKRLEDQQQVLALNDAYNELDRLVGAGEFSLSKAVSDDLHRRVARHEAIEAGNFRGEGSTTGGGSVRLSSGGVVDGRAHGDGGTRLIAAFDELAEYLAGVGDPRERALIYTAAATRHQFYFDGNKRTAKLMGSGILMSAGFDAISVPFTRLYEQNVTLDRLFDTDDATGYMRLLADRAR
ncbi:hypothetical protein [Agromyces archimandritae]|uniref:Fido domain-containing protein n=1 Tax=Agromyces archimandritae TaxID=2781962 RepID=A0A975IPI9_9MICO|nr:hypothetical protein [Agromyces archimandritae]QTX05677.1 hypothetical protein G127AT_05585 [Agromyces archimandritae]